jgi:predicted nucleic acid-binding protein
VKLFLDTNVVMDTLAQRQPWAPEATRVMARIARGEQQGFVAAHTISTMFYLLRKALGSEGALTALRDLVKIVRVVQVDHDTVLQALALGWKDFEDALQVICAINNDSDVFITRDPRDFAPSPIRVLSPQEFLAQHQALGSGDAADHA